MNTNSYYNKNSFRIIISKIKIVFGIKLRKMSLLLNTFSMYLTFCIRLISIENLFD